MQVLRKRLQDLSPADRTRYDKIADEFDEEWLRHPAATPEISAFLPADEPVRTLLLVALAKTDLEARRKRGETVRAEDYIGRHAELVADEAAQVEIILWEYELSKSLEVTLDEYCRRFANLGDTLRRLLPARHPAKSQDGPNVPGYDILEELGRGGMGVVYKARHKKLNRLVALKMILAGSHAGAAELVRFQVEAEAIARLQHPNIVQVHEVGEHEGKPFFSLEFCGGGSLAQKLEGTPLPARSAAALVETLARAMQAAHDQSIIHRDLKPGNVLLQSVASRVDTSLTPDHWAQTPKITDFGLAKKLDEAGQTQSGAVIGTPSYMAPEQARGDSREAGPAVDVYALGAILYELLTGRPPFKAATSLDTLWQVLNQEPVPPSRFQPGVAADLETICLKCLQKAPAQRYARAVELAEDLRRWQAHEPILARPAPVWRRLIQWTRRRPTTAALVTVSLLALFSLLVSGLLWNAELQVALDQVSDSQISAEQARTVGEAFREQARREQLAGTTIRKNAEQVKAQADAKLDRASRILFALQLGEAEGLWRRDPGRGWQLLHDKEQCPVPLRDFTWGHYCRLCRPDRLTRAGSSLALAAGTTFAVGGEQGTVHLVEATGQEQLAFTVPSAAAKERGEGSANAVSAMTLSQDGRLLACADAAGSITLWDMTAGKARATLTGHRWPVVCMAFAHDGRTLVSAGGHVSAGGEIRLWDTLAGNDQGELAPRSIVISLALSADGKTLAAGTWDRELSLWDLATRKIRRQVELDSAVTGLAYAPDGKVLAAATAGGLVEWFDAASANKLQALHGDAAGVYAIAFSPDGRTLAAGYEKGPIMLWDVRTRSVRATLRGHSSRVQSLTFAADGRWLASKEERRLVTIWHLASERAERTLQVAPISPRSLLLKLVGEKPPVHRLGVQAVAFAPDGKQLATGGTDGSVLLWDRLTGKKRTSLPAHPGGVSSLAYHPRGALLASAGFHQTVNVYDLNNGELLATLKGHTSPVMCVAFAPDGRTLASASWDGTFRLWDVATKELLFLSPPHTGGQQLTAVAFAPDGDTLAVASSIGVVRLWDCQRRQVRRILSGHHNWVTALAFSADGQWLASADGEGSIKIWNPATGGELTSCRGRRAWINSLAFSPDGRTLASGSAGLEDAKDTSGVVALWDPAIGKDRAVWLEHAAPVQAVAFSPSSQTLASASLDGTVKLWEADPYSH